MRVCRNFYNLKFQKWKQKRSDFCFTKPNILWKYMLHTPLVSFECQQISLECQKIRNFMKIFIIFSHNTRLFSTAFFKNVWKVELQLQRIDKHKRRFNQPEKNVTRYHLFSTTLPKSGNEAQNLIFYYFNRQN
jgi:hypothetical protein